MLTSFKLFHYNSTLADSFNQPVQTWFIPIYHMNKPRMTNDSISFNPWFRVESVEALFNIFLIRPNLSKTIHIRLKKFAQIEQSNLFVSNQTERLWVESVEASLVEIFVPNLKQELRGLSGFFRRLRSKSCFKMIALSGFRTVYLKKKQLKNRTIFELFWAVYLKKSRPRLERFF